MTKSRKTERLYASAPLDGQDVEHASRSFEIALERLRAAAVLEKREVLFDTLEVEIDRETVDDGALADHVMGSAVRSTSITICVSAEAVLNG